MAIYEVAAQRRQQVHPVQPSPSNFGLDVAALIGDHLENMLGERVFVLDRATGEVGPHVSALDAKGALVIVEIFQTLDAPGLTRALKNVGRLGRHTLAELGQLYSEGPEQFASDYEQFQISTSMTGMGSAAGGSRLVIMCSGADLDALDALDFLQQAGPRIEVKRIGVVHTEDGRRFLDVSPLSGGARRPRGVEPVPETEAQAPAPTPARPVAHKPTDEPPVTTKPFVPAVVSTASGAIPVDPRALRPSTPAQRRGKAAFLRDGAPTETGSSTHPAAYQGAKLRSRVIQEESIDTNQLDLGELRRAHSGSMYAAAMAYGDPGAPIAAPSATGPSAEPDARLAALGARLLVPATLVWTRLRRGERFEATLELDGTITLPDGSSFTDPDEAAAAIGGGGAVDGWRTWRLGDSGPSLSELV